jgi:hypothetical protein
MTSITEAARRAVAPVPPAQLKASDPDAVWPRDHPGGASAGSFVALHNFIARALVRV